MRIILAALLVTGACHPHPGAGVDCGTPPAGFVAWDVRSPVPDIEPLSNTIHLARGGAVTWNGAHLGGLEDLSADAVLDQYLLAAAQLEPRPATRLTFDRGTACRRVDAIRLLMDRRLDCRHAGGCFQGSTHAPARG